MRLVLCDKDLERAYIGLSLGFKSALSKRENL
jgi:hypothetical protein